MLTNRDDAKEATDAYIEAFVSKDSQRVSNAFYSVGNNCPQLRTEGYSLTPLLCGEEEGVLG